MSLSNLIELGILFVLIIGGTALKRYTHLKVSEFDAFDGVMEKHECEGELISKHQE